MNYTKSIKIFSLIIFLVCVIFSFWFFVYAAAEAVEEELKLYVGQVKIIPVNTPTRIIIGNPNVADVTEVRKKEITITSKGAGKTTLVVWDNLGEQSYLIKVFAEDLKDIKSRIDNLLSKLSLPKVYSQIVEEEGKVLLLGRVKTQEEKDRISTALGTLKDKTVDLVEIKEEGLVEIDVQVLELNQDAEKNLGFTWPGSIALTDKTGHVTSATATGITGLSHVFRVSDYTRSGFDVTLDALIQEGKARILSRPRLACQSGKEAELLVGGEKPILTTQAVSGGSTSTTVEYKQFGIKLKIKPVVTEQKQVKLFLFVEVSDVGTVETIGTRSSTETITTASAYPLSTRSASTELVLNDKQTFVLGGLVKQKKEEDIRKTAFLGDLPILGTLFRKKVTKAGGGAGQRGDTELFIMLTPTIINDGLETASLKKGNTTEQVGTNKAIAEPLAKYAGIIQKYLLDNLTYPEAAKEEGVQGTVKLSLLLSYQGELLDLIIKDSSGNKLLDDNAVSVAKKRSPYPPFPSSIDLQELWIDIPITYQLD